MINTAWIIDDDEVYKYGFRKYVKLKNLCSNLIDFKNGKDAINFLKDPANAENLPDLIFFNIDIEKKNWDFILAFEQLTFTGKQIRLFLITPHVNYEDILRAQKHTKILDYTVKPTDSQQFDAAFTMDLLKQIA